MHHSLRERQGFSVLCETCCVMLHNTNKYSLHSTSLYIGPSSSSSLIIQWDQHPWMWFKVDSKPVLQDSEDLWEMTRSVLQSCPGGLLRHEKVVSGLPALQRASQRLPKGTSCLLKKWKCLSEMTAKSPKVAGGLPAPQKGSQRLLKDTPSLKPAPSCRFHYPWKSVSMGVVIESLMDTKGPLYIVMVVAARPPRQSEAGSLLWRGTSHTLCTDHVWYVFLSTMRHNWSSIFWLLDLTVSYLQGFF